MKLYVLGSGTCIPYAKRGSSGYALELSGNKLLLDCGSGTTGKLAKAGVSYLNIDHILLSHLHPDHTGDLVPFLFATKYAYGSKREKPLSLWGGEGFINFFDALKNAYDDWILPDNMTVNELETGKTEFDGFNIISSPTPHMEGSLAFRVEENDKSVVYSGDTDYSDELIELAADTDLLIIECSLPDEASKRKGHLTPGEVAAIINKSGAKKIVVTHLYPICDEARVVETIRKNVSAEVIEAQDLLEMEI
ncbi:MAG: ribonuclease Z [Deltaproteobacteria bacterium]